MILNALLLVVTAILGTASADPPAAKPEDPNKPVGIAVVELFTSEGCSSCPPADKVLAALATKKENEYGRVFTLAFHVDYWDNLGWKDRFASKAFSDRQRAYAARFAKTGGNGGVYTPQMVVNGSVEFVGSNATSAQSAIEDALKTKPKLEIAPVVSTRKAGEPIRIVATVDSVQEPGAKSRPSPDTVVCFALVENGLSTDVKKGENGGHTLAHERVVRAIAQKKIAGGKAEAELKVPEGAKEESCRVVVYAQDGETLKVLGAAEVGLASPKAEEPAKPAAAPNGTSAPSQSPNPAQKK
jgi:hypothetical protein